MWSSKGEIHLVYILFLLILKHLNNKEYQLFVNSSEKDDRKIVEIIHKFNDNNLEIKISTFRFRVNLREKTKVSNTEINIIELIQIYLKFFNITYETFNKRRNSSKISIQNNIYEVVEKEISNQDFLEKINLSIFKYSNLVEHSGQLS